MGNSLVYGTASAIEIKRKYRVKSKKLYSSVSVQENTENIKSNISNKNIINDCTINNKK